MLVAMRATGVTTPEAVLAELVTPTAEAAIAEASHTVATTVGAGDGMIDCEERDAESVKNRLINSKYK